MGVPILYSPGLDTSARRVSEITSEGDLIAEQLINYVGHLSGVSTGVVIDRSGTAAVHGRKDGVGAVRGTAESGRDCPWHAC
jgi:hypothetical protein